MRLVPASFGLVLTACGPFLTFPGGALNGQVKPAPESFGFTATTKTIQLETRPDDPYSVNIWCAAVGNHLYVSAGANKSTWVENMEADSRVRARIDGSLYELTAQRVVDDSEMRAFAKAWTTKYSSGRDPTELGEVWVYRLEARSPQP